VVLVEQLPYLPDDIFHRPRLRLPIFELQLGQVGQQGERLLSDWELEFEIGVYICWVGVDGRRLVGLVAVVSEFEGFPRLFEGKARQRPPDSQFILEVHAVLERFVVRFIIAFVVVMGAFWVLAVGGERVLVEGGGEVVGGGVEGGDDLVGGVALAVGAGDEFLEVLVDVVGRPVAQELRDFGDTLQQVRSHESLEELEVQLVERLHRKSDCLSRRHLNSIITLTILSNHTAAPHHLFSAALRGHFRWAINYLIIIQMSEQRRNEIL
jgi:hypothetical protein